MNRRPVYVGCSLVALGYMLVAVTAGYILVPDRMPFHGRHHHGTPAP